MTNIPCHIFLQRVIALVSHCVGKARSDEPPATYNIRKTWLMQAPMHSLLLVIKISNGPYYSSKHLSSVSSDTEVTCSKQLQLQKSLHMSHTNAVFVIYLQKL